MKPLSRTMVVTGGLALSGVIVASLAVAGNFGHHQKRGHMFTAASLDADGDGALTQDEVLAHNRIRFDRLDSDGDGSISPDEFSARLVTMFTRIQTVTACWRGMNFRIGWDGTDITMGAIIIATGKDMDIRMDPAPRPRIR